MKQAIIDIGSNSIRLTACDTDGFFQKYAGKQFVLRI